MTGKFLFLLALSALPFALAGDLLQTSSALFFLLAKECTDRHQPNFVFSPYSVLSGLHVAQRGADGETKRQMDDLVASNQDFVIPVFDIPPFYELTQPVKLLAANRIYAYKALEGNKYFTSFSKDVESIMDADAKTIDFSKSQLAAKEMNNWLSERTKGTISDLINASTLSSTTRLVLLNALYFSAPWTTKFDKSATYEDVFFAQTPKGPQEQRVFFMRNKDVDDAVTYLEQDGLQAFSMPYLDKNLRLFVFMPDDINDFQLKLSQGRNIFERLTQRVRHANLWDRRLDISMPKFKLTAATNRFDLVSAFKTLGATSMFDKSKANFTGISGRRDLYLSIFPHQATVDVGEDGSLATAGTAPRLMGAPPPVPHTEPIFPETLPTVHLKVNKPFLFAVRFDDNQRSFPLLTGRILDAKAAQPS